MKIECGDKVRVYLLNGNTINGIVQAYACATGDCWQIEEENKTIHYVQTFQQIVKYPTATKKELPF